MQDSINSDTAIVSQKIIKPSRVLFLEEINWIFLIISTLGAFCFAGDLAGLEFAWAGVILFLFSFPLATILLIAAVYALVRNSAAKIGAGNHMRIKTLAGWSICASFVVFLSSIMWVVIPSGKNMSPYIWLFLLFMSIEFSVLLTSRIIYNHILKCPENERYNSTQLYQQSQQSDTDLLRERAKLVLIYALLALLLSYGNHEMIVSSVIEHHAGSGLIGIPLMFLCIMFTVIAISQSIKTVILYLTHHIRKLPLLVAHICCILGVLITIAAISLLVHTSIILLTW